MCRRMKTLNQIVPSYFLLFCCFILSAFASDFKVGQSVILQATNPKGIPLHHEPSPSFWKHVSNNSVATIKQIEKDGRWLSILLDSGETGWVVQKYVRPTAQSREVPHKKLGFASEEGAVWTSRDQCEQVVNTGGRMATSSPSTLRLATWNLRWFPNGQSEKQSNGSTGPTDLQWLTCTITWMQIDILSVQESLATPRANKAWGDVLQSLQKRTGSTWRWTRQKCGHPDEHHIGLLWNADRVTLSRIDSLWQFNAKAKSGENPCANGLRPGHYAWVQSHAKDGVDFHLIGLHLKSGPTVFAVEERHKALNRLDQVVAPLLDLDQDVVILGDFNTMGAGDWKSRNYELKNLHRLVAKEKPGFKDLPLKPQCSHYFRGRGGWLDHVLVAKGTSEVTTSSAKVTGYCAVAGCQRIKGDYPLAYRRLSDHCPVILEIQNRDED